LTRFVIAFTVSKTEDGFNMSRFKGYQLIAFIWLLTVPLFSLAQAKTINIPVLANAKIFAKFEDGTPAVVNFFTRATEQQVISFYVQHFGDVTSKQRKRGRLTLQFKQQNASIRVVVSKQNNMTQVDVIKIIKSVKQ